MNINLNSHCYNYVLGIIDTKIYKSKQITSKKTNKNVYIVKFGSKALETVWLKKFFNHPDIIKTLPYNLQE